MLRMCICMVAAFLHEFLMFVWVVLVKLNECINSISPTLSVWYHNFYRMCSQLLISANDSEN